MWLSYNTLQMAHFQPVIDIPHPPGSLIIPTVVVILGATRKGAGSIPTPHSGTIEASTRLGVVLTRGASDAISIAVMCVCVCLVSAPQCILRVLVD